MLPPSPSLGSSSFGLCCDLVSLSVLSLPVGPSVPTFMIMGPFLYRGVPCFYFPCHSLCLAHSLPSCFLPSCTIWFVVSPLLGSKDRHMGMGAPRSLVLESPFLANTGASGPPLTARTQASAWRVAAITEHRAHRGYCPHIPSCRLGSVCRGVTLLAHSYSPRKQSGWDLNPDSGRWGYLH